MSRTATKPVGRTNPSPTAPSSATGSKVTHPTCILEAQTLGVSKIKSQLRQAKRLLSKEGLKEDLKRTTEQKIVELQAALEGHPTKEKERQNAIKYHRIKFFDRQKVTRRLKKVLREINQLDDSSPEHQKKTRKLEKKARCFRVDLNYVLHYPNHLKYIALCPGGEYKRHPSTPTTLGTNVPSSKSPDLLRNYVRAYISQAMEAGTLGKTPETSAAPQAEQGTEAFDETGDQSMKKAGSPEVDDFFAPDSGL